MKSAPSPLMGAAFPVRILVVDDFEPWRRSVCSILKVHPELHVVGEAADGWEAVQKARELKADLILLDMSMPGLNGIDAARRIRQIVPGTKMLFLTQVNDKDLVRAAFDTGAQAYILKTDASSRVLLSAIHAVLRGERFVSSGIKG